MVFQPKNKNQRQSPTQQRRSPLATYYRSDKQEGDSPFARRTPKRRLRKYFFGFLDIILIATIIFGLLYSMVVRPNPTVFANSVSFHSRADYQAASAAQLRHLSYRNKITFDEHKLALAIEKQFPEVTSVQVELPLFSERPTIRLNISSATFFINSNGNRYIIDSAGRAVALASTLPKMVAMSANVRLLITKS